MLARDHNLTNQRGAAFLLLVVTLVLGAAAVFHGLSRPSGLDAERDRKTEAALVKARDALIGYAAENGTRPGNLPCPDRNNNGQQTTPCNTVATRIGLFPWRTLQTDDLRDGTGAPLLYAVSNIYRGAAGILNSDTPGDYTVTGTTPASSVIAVVFAPGQVVGTQQRDATVALCSTTGTNIARNRCPANYLESGNENGDANFVSAFPSATFNDRLLVITRDNLFPAVTARVAREVRTALNTFYTANNRFPNAALFADATYTCNTAATQGRIAQVSAPGCPIIPLPVAAGSLPLWFSANNWHQLIFYAVSPLCISAATAASCISTGGLTVLTDCLEDAENLNGDSVFQQPALSASNNDRLVIVAP
jgi:type II secretory pathway pseudopilin PulG